MIRPNTFDEAPESETVRQSIGQVVNDFVALAELQGLLFKSDAREIAEQIVRPVVVLAAGVLLFAATVPVCLLAIAEGLVAGGASRAAALVLAAVLGVIAAAGMGTWAWWRLHRMPPAFAHSREELVRNISWFKDALRDSSSLSPADHP